MYVRMCECMCVCLVCETYEVKRATVCMGSNEKAKSNVVLKPSKFHEVLTAQVISHRLFRHHFGLFCKTFGSRLLSLL